MKIEIKTSNSKGFSSSVKVNGVDLSKFVERYRLHQEAGKLPVLSVDIPVTEMDIEIPEGCVVVNWEGKEHETECRSSADCD